MDVATRFWSKVDVRSEDECWEWIGINSGFKTDKGSQNIKRVAWVLTFGEVPKGKRVYSSCKANCVNPKHLFLATYREMFLKRLQGWSGENHPRAKLKEKDVMKIRTLTGKVPIVRLARRYGVSPACVADIQKGRNWKNVGERGQSLVEFAFSFMLLMLLLVGIVEFGIIFFQYVQLRDAAQEGAQYGSICLTNDASSCDLADIEGRARASSDSPVNLSDISQVYVEVTAADQLGVTKALETACEGDSLSVRASYVHKIFMPFLPALIGRNEITLSAVAINTVLRPVC